MVLGEIGPPAVAAVDLLCKQLLAEWRKERWDRDAATALVLIGDERAVPVLATAANEEAPWEALNEWIQVYFDDRGREASSAIPVLMRMLNEPVFRYNRYYILSWIRGYHPAGSRVPEDLSGLQRCLRDSNEEICSKAALAAGWFGKAADSLLPDVLEAHAAGRLLKPEYPVDAIIVALRGNPEPLSEWIRAEENRFSRGGFRDYRIWRRWALKEGTGEYVKVVPQLLRVVLQGSEQDQLRALHSLAAIGPDAAPAVPLLLDLLRRAKTPAMCDALAELLGAIGPEAEEAVPVLAELLLERHPAGDWKSTNYALCALKNIRSPKAIATLIQALGRTDPYQVRYDAAGVLGDLGKKAVAALPMLEELLRSPDHPWYGAETVSKAIQRIKRSRDE